MSENKHTPEPWRTDEECGFPQDIHDSKGNLFLRCGSDFDNEIYGEANARRITACVNRLAQFTTEQIEDFGYDLFAEDRPRLVEAQNEIHLLKKQRDELLAALENCRLLAARHRKEEWAGHVLRFCGESGVAGEVMR